MPRRKGDRNKRTIDREAGNIVAPPDSRMPVAPVMAAPRFDSLDELRKTARIFLGLAAEEQRKGERRDNALFARYLNQAARICSMIAPYEHPVLKSVEIKRHADLTKLTTEQLAVYEQLCAIVAGTESGGVPGRTNPALN